MSSRAENSFLWGLAIGVVLGCIVCGYITNVAWEMKLVKERTYEWTANPRTGETTLIQRYFKEES